jgi:hypothetical protein
LRHGKCYCWHWCWRALRSLCWIARELISRMKVFFGTECSARLPGKCPCEIFSPTIPGPSDGQLFDCLRRFAKDNIAASEDVLFAPFTPGLYPILNRHSPSWEIYFVLPAPEQRCADFWRSSCPGWLRNHSSGTKLLQGHACHRTLSRKLLPNIAKHSSVWRIKNLSYPDSRFASVVHARAGPDPGWRCIGKKV